MDNAINGLNSKAAAVSKDTDKIINKVKNTNESTLNTIAKCENKVSKQGAVGSLKVSNAIATTVAKTSTQEAMKSRNKEVGEIREKYEKVSDKIEKLEGNESLKENLKDSVGKLTQMKATSSGNEVIRNLSEINSTLNDYKGTDPKVNEISADLKDLGMNTMVKAGQWMEMEKKMEIEALKEKTRRDEIRDLEMQEAAKKRAADREKQKAAETAKARDAAKTKNAVKPQNAAKPQNVKQVNRPQKQNDVETAKTNNITAIRAERPKTQTGNMQAGKAGPQKSEMEKRIEARRKRNAKKTEKIRKGLDKFAADAAKKNKNNGLIK